MSSMRTGRSRFTCSRHVAHVLNRRPVTGAFPHVWHVGSGPGFAASQHHWHRLANGERAGYIPHPVQIRGPIGFGLHLCDTMPVR